MPRAWGTVGTGQAEEACPQARIAGWQGRDSGHGHGWARGPGSGSSGGPNKRAGNPGDRPAVPGRTARAVPGPRDRAEETRGRSAPTPGARGPVTSPTRRVRDRGWRRNTGGPPAVGWRARADRARRRTRSGGAGLRPYARRTRAERRRGRARSRHPIPGYPNHVTRYRGLHSATLQLYCNCTSPAIGVNVYDQTVTAVAGIPQGFTKVMM